MIVEKSIKVFTKGNKNSNIIKRLKGANERRDREAFIQLLDQTRKTVKSKQEIKRLKRCIESHVNSIEDIEREIRIIVVKYAVGLIIAIRRK